MKVKIAVVGAGLCGSLLAIRLAQRGHEVHLFERRGDLRKQEVDAGRSINLALSDRGLQALSLVGLDTTIQDSIIPMKGRMLHDREGKTLFSPYSGRESDYINSVSRSGLNAALLDLAENESSLHLHFNSSCQSYDWDTNTLHVTYNGKVTKHTYDVVFGADGAGSVIRRTFMKHGNQIRFDYQQQYLTHGYKELEFPATEVGDYCMEPNALHIWPRDDYMMIALPNLDRSFTVTLFQAFKGPQGFDTLTDKDRVLDFFTQAFPDAVPYMPNLIQDFFTNPTSSLGTIKCFPWYYEDKVLLLGDAVHAIVPFYGQGMNCAFEDVWVLEKYIDAYSSDWDTIFAAYAAERKKDTDAIADLALDNFYEMQDKVNDDDFIVKRQIERRMEQEIEDYFSKYSLVTFREDLPYHQAMMQGRFQDEYLLRVARTHKNTDAIDIHALYQSLTQEMKKQFDWL